MKNLLTLLLVLLFSCTKKHHHETAAEPILIDGNVKSIEAMPDFTYAASSEFDLHATKKISYNHSPIIVYEIPSKLHAGKSLVLLSLNNRFVETVSLTTILPENVRLWQLLSTENREYYSFKVNSENRIGDFRVLNDIPFYELLEAPALMNAVPVPDGTAALTCYQKTKTFGACMSCAASECFSGWKCGFMCGQVPAVLACAVGWSIGCAGVQYIENRLNPVNPQKGEPYIPNLQP